MDDQLKKMLKQLKENESTLSMLLGGLVVIIVAILLFNYFKSPNPQPEVSDNGEATTSAEYTLDLEENSEGETVPSGLPREHTVAKGDHLWAIAEKYYGSGYNWVDIAAENNITNGNMLAEGTTLRIPKVAVKQVTQEVKAAEPTKAALEVQVEGDSYTVAKGDSLWKIAVAAYGDGYQWTAIYNANKDGIGNPNKIEVGQQLSIPRT